MGVGGRDPRSRYGSLTAPSPWQRYTLQVGVGPVSAGAFRRK
jgi:hypothetical protein